MTTTIDRTAYDANLQRVGLRLRSMIDRILRTYDRATGEDRANGQAWYDRAHELARELASDLGGLDYAACVISHLSPRTKWGRNARAARDLAAGRHPSYALGANVDRARRALQSADPHATFGAHKTRNFARNILGDVECVTVDVWAARIAMGKQVPDPEATLRRVGVYEAVEHAYRLAARRRGVTPREMQATTWVVVRNGRAE